MAIESWDNFNKKTINEGLKKFSDNKKSNVTKSVKSPIRGNSSASSEYADNVNQNILKGDSNKPSSTSKERTYPTKRVEQTIKDKSIYPKDTDDRGVSNMSEGNSVEFYGKLAKFPDGVPASKAYKWMHNLQDPKLAKKDIWYLMVEKQNSELQMIKYHQKEGVNLTKFIVDLKAYYNSKYESNPSIVESINKIKLGGDKDGNISSIANIPNIKLEGRSLIQHITESLIKLLS